jgi:hypothetical protein
LYKFNTGRSFDTKNFCDKTDYPGVAVGVQKPPKRRENQHNCVQLKVALKDIDLGELNLQV